MFYALIVDTPPDILFAGVEAVAPPGVLFWFFTEMAECVYVVAAENDVETVCNKLITFFEHCVADPETSSG